MPSDPDELNLRITAANLSIQSGFRLTPQEFLDFLREQPRPAVVSPLDPHAFTTNSPPYGTNSDPGPDRNLPA